MCRILGGDLGCTDAVPTGQYVVLSDLRENTRLVLVDGLSERLTLLVQLLLPLPRTLLDEEMDRMRLQRQFSTAVECSRPCNDSRVLEVSRRSTTHTPLSAHTVRGDPRESVLTSCSRAHRMDLLPFLPACIHRSKGSAHSAPHSRLVTLSPRDSCPAGLCSSNLFLSTQTIRRGRT